MIDLHTHTLLSDGVLLPSELARRAEDMGFRLIGITDHVDMVNAGRVAAEIAETAKALNGRIKLKIIPGVEITHVPPELIADTVGKARAAGAEIVLVHGETPVEPVMAGTNRAGIEAGADILAHPGLITDEDAGLAREKGTLLEISGRAGHCYANGHVAAAAARCGARLSFGSDTHAPGDLRDFEAAVGIILGAGLSGRDAENIFKNMLEKG